MTRNAKNSLLAACLATLLLAGGCPKKYHHEELALDGPVAKQLLALVADLRQAAADDDALAALIRRQAADGLDNAALSQLLAALPPIARAKDVQLIQLDRYGQAYRAGFRLTNPESPQPAEPFFLVVPDKQKSLHWLKTNN